MYSKGFGGTFKPLSSPFFRPEGKRHLCKEGKKFSTGLSTTIAGREGGDVPFAKTQRAGCGKPRRPCPLFGTGGALLFRRGTPFHCGRSVLPEIHETTQGLALLGCVFLEPQGLMRRRIGGNPSKENETPLASQRQPQGVSCWDTEGLEVGYGGFRGQTA